MRHIILTNNDGESVAVFLEKITVIQTLKDVAPSTCKTEIQGQGMLQVWVREPVAVVLKMVNDSYNTQHPSNYR